MSRRGRLYPPVVPPPGSLRAGDLGCSCPIIDNYGGRFLPHEGWVLNLECTVHTPGVQWSAPRGIAPPAAQASRARARVAIEGVPA